MHRWHVITVETLAMVCLLLATARAAETYGNFHTLGIVLDPPDGVRVRDVAEVRLYELRGSEPRRLIDPVPVGEFDWYAVSVFDLTPDTEYAFRAVFIGQGGRELGREEFTGRTRPDPTEPPPAMLEVHVSPTGDDAASGAVSQPKKTIVAALKSARPGAHIVLHGGVYYEGQIGIYRGGTADAPLVIRAAAGEQVFIDGSNPAANEEGWQDLGGGYFSRPFKTNTHLVCTENIKSHVVRRMYPITDKTDFENRRAGKHRFDQFDIREAFRTSDGELTIYCPDFKPGGDVAIRASARGGAFELSKAAHVVFSDLTFRFFEGQVIYVNDASDVTIRRCSFEHSNVPIAVKRKSDRLLVEKCRFFDDCNRWGFLPKSADGSNYSNEIEKGAVYVHFPFDGRGLVFRDCMIEGLFDGAHLAPTGASPKPRTSEIDFYRNKVRGICDDFIEIDGFSRNVRVFDNVMEKCLTGVSIAQAVHGPTYVVRNIIAGSGESTASTRPPYFEGYPVKTNGGDKLGATGWAFFYHNTAWTDAPETNAFCVKVANWRKLVLANNIWAGTRDGFVFWRDAIAPIEMQTDIVFAETGPVLKIGKTKYADVRSALQALPAFSGVLYTAPMLANPSSSDFRPALGSPAIDAGTIVPGINDRRFSGAAPDIGAVEINAR